MLGELSLILVLSLAAPAVQGENYERGYRYSGPSAIVWRSIIVADEDECHEEANESHHGYYFAFDTTTNKCQILTRSAITRRRVDEGWVSGPWSYGTPKAGCFEEETWYMGRRMFALSNVSDAELCQQLCFGHSGCHFFSYQVDQGVCHFKEGVRYPKTEQRSSMVSGPSNCPPPRLCEPGWLGYREVNLCYHVAFFVEELHTAAEASAWCDFEPDSHPDSKIAEPRTREQQDAVANFYRTLELSDISWIGLERSEPGGDFSWRSDGAPLDQSLAPWAPGQPADEGDCVALDPASGFWSSTPCEGTRHMTLCQYVPETDE